MTAKSSQLQIRVSPQEKAALRRLARAAGLDVSSYVLSRALPNTALEFGRLVRALRNTDDRRYALAGLNDLLAGLGSAQLPPAVAALPREFHHLPALDQAYVAAMVEHVCHQQRVAPPAWTRDIPGPDAPHFATPLAGLRMHLLRTAPVPFRRRNIFVDATVGARV